MTLESDILADFRQLLAEHGVTAHWHGTDFPAIASRTRREQQIDLRVVTSQKALDTYITRIQKRVGFAKASWLNAGKAVGGRIRGAVQWATRHKQAPGTATIKTGDKPAVTLANTTDQVRPAQPPAPRGQGEARCAAGLRQAPGQDSLPAARRPAPHRRPVPPLSLIRW